MDPDDIRKLRDFAAVIDRSKLRFNGIGPRLHDKPDLLWPRDEIDPQRECDKIIYLELERLINCEQKVKSIKAFLSQIFINLKQCNTSNLFNRYCPLDPGYSAKEIDSCHIAISMQAFTRNKYILDFMNQALRSINRSRRNKNLLKKLFGSNHNYDIFKKNIKWLVQGNSKLRRIRIGHFILLDGSSTPHMDIDKVEWLHGLNIEIKYRIFIQVLWSVTRFLAELLRRYFYISVTNPYANKLVYYRYDLWQKMQSKTINHYISRGLLRQVEIDDTRLPKNGTSKMKFHLKKDNLRLICTKQKKLTWAGNDHAILMAVLKYVLINMPNYVKFSLNHLLAGLRDFRQRAGSGPIYYVRADLEDCFQSINQEKLVNIIMDNLNRLQPGEQVNLWRLVCSYKIIGRRGRESNVWSLDPEAEKADDRYDQVHSMGLQQIPKHIFLNQLLRPQVVNPILRESKDSKYGYYLTAGIRQGSSLSPKLCAIYLQEAFNCGMKEIFERHDCKLFRYVDDILFLTTDLEEAKRFVTKLGVGFEGFELRSNMDKLSCNFEFNQSNQDSGNGTTTTTPVPRSDEHVIFYRRKFQLRDLSSSYNYCYNGINLDQTFSVSPYFDLDYICNSICKLSRIEPIHLDYELNGVSQVKQNIFEAGLLGGHRLATLILLSFQYRQLGNQNPKFLVLMIRRIALSIKASIRAAVRRKIIDNKLSMSQIRLIVAGAILATWKQTKLRHRKRDLKILLRYFNHQKMKYLSAVENKDNQFELENKQKFESMVHEMMRFFPNSSIHRELILPNNP